MSLVRRHPVVTFFVLTYVLSWAAIPWNSFFAPGALIAALIVVSLTQDVAGLRALGARMIRWRVHWGWYAAALGVPLVVLAATVGLTVGFGGDTLTLRQFTPWYGFLFALGYTVVLGGPLSEETSFRGFALPQLQGRRSPLPAAAILAVLITGWHLPLFFLPSFGLQPIEAATTVAVTFWYVWLFDHARGSVLIVFLAHAMEGAVAREQLWSAGADRAISTWVNFALWGAVVLGLLVFDRTFWTSRAPDEARVEPPERREAVPVGHAT